jgi:hypothetical protein
MNIIVRRFKLCSQQALTDRLNLGQVTIDMIPEDILLEIFSFYVDETEDIDTWHTLVHVCQSWRHVVFGSPLCLNLRLFCTDRRPVRKMLDIWPPLPIVIGYNGDPVLPASAKGMDNIIAALGHRDRVSEIDLWGVSSSLWERFAAMTQKPFPALTSLHLGSSNEWVPHVPDSFLDGSAPCLRRLSITKVPFPTLRKLLLSASDLVHLDLFIPRSAYISPQDMVACLSGMSGLATLNLTFPPHGYCPSRTTQRPPVPTRMVLPSLILLCYRGSSEYLENLVAQIETPALVTLSIMFIGFIFPIPQLYQFITRAERFELPGRAALEFHATDICLKFMPSNCFDLAIGCNNMLGQVSFIPAICHELSLLLSHVERLDILDKHDVWLAQRTIMPTFPWLELFRPFIAVRSLYVSKKLCPFVVSALQALTGQRAAEVLPRLICIPIEGFLPSGLWDQALKSFVNARQQSGCPITIVAWHWVLAGHHDVF